VTASESPGTEPKSRYAQAADWYLRIREGEAKGTELSAEEIQAWERFHADADNRAALELAVRVSGHARRLARSDLTAIQAGEDDGYDGSVSVAEWLARGPGKKTLLQPRPARWGRVALLAAACTVLAVGVAGFHLWRGPRAAISQVIRAAPGEQRTLTLPDGSRVTVGGRTELSVAYTARERTIYLTEGEALFAVAHNRARPFVVHAGSGTITAVGTQFNVRDTLDRVTVTVTEGTVVVAPVKPESLLALALPAVHWEPVRVGNGQAVTYDSTKQRGSVESADSAATDWTVGRLQYRDVPLKYVVADLDRYRSQQIVVQDPAAGELEFTGVIFRNHIGEWARALERIFPVRVRSEGTRVIIESRPTDSGGGSSPRAPQ
jgi:transmembrane sensor